MVHRVATHYILGIRPENDGLRIEPAIPKDWDKFSVKRQYRGSTLHITVLNPQHKTHGVTSMLIDGKHVEGNLVPIFNDGKDHTIMVSL